MKQALIAGATATALAITAIAPATAAPVLSNTAAVKSAADNAVVDVRWGWGGWLAAGVIGGIALGALTSPYYGYGYAPAYSYPYSYSYPYANSYPYASYPSYSSYAYANNGPVQTSCPQSNGTPFYQIKLTYENNIWLTQNYWYTPGTLNFITLEGEEKKTPISSIDRALTFQLNSSCGVNFQFPK